MRYYILNNPANWLTDSILAHNFAMYGIGGEILKTILVSILEFFQEKLMTKFLKNPKRPILRPFWTLFNQIWAKMSFPGIKGSVSFYIFQLSTIVPKIRKKLLSHFSEKCWTDWRTEKQTDRQTNWQAYIRWFYRNLRRTGVLNVKAIRQW